MTHVAANKRRHDELYPRGMGVHRYRIYRLRAGVTAIVATAPTAERMGRRLAQAYARGSFIADDSVGVLDTKTDPGKWIVNPWTLGRKP